MGKLDDHGSSSQVETQVPPSSWEPRPACNQASQLTKVPSDLEHQAGPVRSSRLTSRIRGEQRGLRTMNTRKLGTMAPWATWPHGPRVTGATSYQFTRCAHMVDGILISSSTGQIADEISMAPGFPA